MYLWKCWRDTRSAFRGFVAGLLAVGIFCMYVQFDPFGWIAAKPESSRFLWHMMSDALGAQLSKMILIAGFILGAMGVGVEFERGTADFLLTRPRARRAFLWTSWCLGAAQMLTLVLLAHAITWFTRPDFSAARPGLFSRDSLGMCTLALLTYSLTYLMTTLARNSRNGTGLSLAAFSAYIGLYAWLRFWHGITIPNLVELFEPGVWFGSLLGWLAVGLTLMVVAQFRFERAEV
jgi:ABC-type transport system involved in multi-copper enzyme maturation permease subunit